MTRKYQQDTYTYVDFISGSGGPSEIIRRQAPITLDTMLPSILLLLLGVVATLSLAKDPHSQTPGTVKNITADTSNDQCDPTTVGVVGGGQIQVADCFDILDFPNTANFSVEMLDWRDSASLPDKFYKLFTVGSCELAVKRIDGGKNTSW